MAAVVRIVQKNGAGATATDAASGIRFKNADNATVDLVNPMVEPTSGSDSSFEKWLRLEVTGGTYSQITNIKAYSDGTNSLDWLTWSSGASDPSKRVSAHFLVKHNPTMDDRGWQLVRLRDTCWATAYANGHPL